MFQKCDGFWAIFRSYVSLPEGISRARWDDRPTDRTGGGLLGLLPCILEDEHTNEKLHSNVAISRAHKS